MTSLSDPPCLIEHEIYVENAVWILHTLSTRECSSNERPRGERGTLLFSYIRRLGPFFGGSKFWISIFFLVFRKMNIFGGVKNIFLGCLKFLIFVCGGWAVDAGPEHTYEEQIRVPPGVSVQCYVDWRAHLNVILMNWLIKNRFSKSGKNWAPKTFQVLNVENPVS